MKFNSQSVLINPNLSYNNLQSIYIHFLYSKKNILFAFLCFAKIHKQIQLYR